jgi:hypothetical protein
MKFMFLKKNVSKYLRKTVGNAAYSLYESVLDFLCNFMLHKSTSVYVTFLKLIVDTLSTQISRAKASSCSNFQRCCNTCRADKSTDKTACCPWLACMGLKKIKNIIKKYCNRRRLIKKCLRSIKSEHFMTVSWRVSKIFAALKCVTLTVLCSS